jgi:transcriptional regulator with XRE-family HTH domain
MADRRLLGTRLLGEYLARHGLSKADVAKRTEGCSTPVDRVTVSNLANGRAHRVTVGVALAIESATNGEVPASSWDAEDAPQARDSVPHGGA